MKRYTSEAGEFFTLPFFTKDVVIFIESGGATWEELGIDQEEFDNLASQAYVRVCKEKIAKMRDGTFPSEDVPSHASEIIAFVKSGKTNLEELGTRQEELDKLVRQAYVNKYIATIAKMRKGAHSGDRVLFYAADILASIEGGRTTWEELGTSQEELDNLARQANVQEYRTIISEMSGGPYSDEVALILTKMITAFVESGETTWKELGTTKREFNRMLKRSYGIRVRAGKKISDGS